MTKARPADFHMNYLVLCFIRISRVSGYRLSNDGL